MDFSEEHNNNDPSLKPSNSKTQNPPTYFDPFYDNPLDQTLVKPFHDLSFFNDSDNDVSIEEKDSGKHEEGVSNGAIPQYPLRPHAEDCPFYVKTGMCKFGQACKFNHPVTGAIQKKERERGDFSERTGQIECKYYRSDGGCKYGKACKYYHFEENIQRNKPEINFLGLPMRPLEKECPFYMRTGSCGYGVNCRFHHPDPTEAKESSPFNSRSVPAGGYSWANYNGQSDTVQPMRSIIPDAAPCSHVLPSKADPDLDNHSPCASGMQSQAEDLELKPEWSRYQQRRKNQMNVSTINQQEMLGEDFPERPGKPECDYFVKTGNCKYRSACRYHHPKDHA